MLSTIIVEEIMKLHTEYILIGTLILMLVGCADNDNLVIKNGQNSIDLSSKSIVLFSSNMGGPEINCAAIGIGGFEETEKKKLFEVYEIVPYHSRYLVCMRLLPGNYNAIGVIGYLVEDRGPVQGIAYGRCQLSLKTRIDVKPNSIVYLGSINAKMRERKNDEIQAAYKPPILDRNIFKFYSSTFDFSIEDKYDEDLRGFYGQYPALRKAIIEKSILPQTSKSVESIIESLL
jgi:hypothetical protein